MKRTVIAIAAVLAIALGGCSQKATEQFRDAPRGATVNRDPGNIVEMPDGFSNLAGKCDGPDYVYVVFHSDSNYAALAVVPNDKRCTR